ncbi:MAG: T9SS type A sorting domain-containing protein [Prolixibacteraceae bacterium]|jgi:hypothetical protein|nr:T9SS type A sorting domain-containing protein [Prolixibacteraceae bacterium]
MKNLFFIIPLLLLFSGTVLHAQDSLVVVSEVNLFSDGPEGIDTYGLIESKFGIGCIEAPDLYAVNHPGVEHIIESSDNEVGNHFVFKIHKNDDGDRDTGKTDRQRNEIKTYANSANTVIGFKGETLRFHWYFKLQEGFSISKNFSHFFQFKAVGGNDSSQPIVTISGSINSDRPEFEIIYNSGNGTSDKQLIHTDWEVANTGEWMEIEAVARFEDDGYLKITISDLWGNQLLAVEKEGIDLWRTGGTFVRPKWGIYRSLNSKSYLSDDEETAGFANFSIQKLEIEDNTGFGSQVSINEGSYIFPNPVEDILQLKFNTSYTGNLKVYDLNAKLVHQISIFQTSQIEWDTHNLMPGLYLIRMDNQLLELKFIKF